MEAPGKSTALYLFAICYAVVMLVAVLVDLLRPQLPDIEPVAGTYPLGDDNWFSKRSFKLLSAEGSVFKGIDAGQNPFVPMVRESELKEPEPLVVAPEAEPTPPEPEMREISLLYRGLYRSSSGRPFVYLEVENTMRVYSINDLVAPGWRIADADASQLILTQGETVRRLFPFNQKKSLEVPIMPQP